MPAEATEHEYEALKRYREATDETWERNIAFRDFTNDPSWLVQKSLCPSKLRDNRAVRLPLSFARCGDALASRVQPGVRISGTGALGMDYERGALLTGFALTHSLGEGTAHGEGRSYVLGSAVTTMLPYARWALSERISAWGLRGRARAD